MDGATSKIELMAVNGEMQDRSQKIALRKWEITGKIQWPIGKFRIAHIFENEGDEPLEIVYTFPISSVQLLDGFDVYLDGEHVSSELVDIEEAESRYERAMENGDFATKLRENRSNVFNLNIGNLAPGQKVRIEYRLSQFMEVAEKRIQIRIPTVVGPRYVPGEPIDGNNGLGWAPPTDAVEDADEVTPPFQFEDVPYRVSAMFEISGGIEVEEIDSPSHPFRISIKKDGGYVAYMGDNLHADRDILLTVHLAKDQKDLLWDLQRKDQRVATVILWGRKTPEKPRMPRDILFLIDISGSMSGEKLDTAVKGARLCLRKLREEDRLQLMAFESEVHFWRRRKGWQEVNEENLKDADGWLKSLESMGGTELYRAMKEALTFPRHPGRERIIILITDGQVADESRIAHLIRTKGNDARYVLIGVDTTLNEDLFKQISRDVPTIAESVYPGEDVGKAVNLQFERLDAWWITDIEFIGGGRKIKSQIVAPRIPFVLNQNSAAFVFANLSGDDKIDGVKILYEDGSWEERGLADVAAQKAVENELLRFWAKKVIELAERGNLGDMGYEKKFARQLAMDMKIQSKFTSWIAVQEREEKIENPAKVQVIPVNFPHLWDPDQFGMERHVQYKLMMNNALQVDQMFIAKRPLLIKTADVLIDWLLLQQSDGSFVIGRNRKDVIVDTLALLIMILEKVRQGEERLESYKSNLTKALHFLRKNQRRFRQKEKSMWNYLKWRYGNLIKQLGIEIGVEAERDEKELFRIAEEIGKVIEEIEEGEIEELNEIKRQIVACF